MTNKINDSRKMKEHLSEFIQLIERCEGEAFAVGGCVRDLVMKISPVDYDIEVYNVQENVLRKALKQKWKVEIVGKAFGVMKVHVPGLEEPLDVTLPRCDTKISNKHSGFTVSKDPFMNKKEACQRRDFTMNAMMINLHTGTILDFFGGQRDIKDRIIRQVDSNHFKEDPLRPLRAMQFCSRFDMDFDRNITCTEEGWKHLPVERIWGEWEKWAKKAKRPSAGIEMLKQSGWIQAFPEIACLEEIEQDPNWHPEGSVLDHTMHTVDMMNKLLSSSEKTDNERIVLIFAALCHDFGKSTTTTVENGKIRSKGHAKAGEGPVRSFLKRIGAPIWVVERVVPLVVNHMSQWNTKVTERAIRRLAVRVSPSTIDDLHFVIRSDFLGRPPLNNKDPFLELSELAKKLKVIDTTPTNILMGRHLLELKVPPGITMGIILRDSMEAQLNGEFSNLEEAIEWAKKRIKKQNSRIETQENK